MPRRRASSKHWRCDYWIIRLREMTDCTLLHGNGLNRAVHFTPIFQGHPLANLQCII